MEERTEFFRKRTPVEVVVDAFRFVFANGRMVLAGMLAVAGPILVVSTAVFSWYWFELEELTDPGDIASVVYEAASEPAYYVVALTSLLAQVVLVGAMHVFLILYVENDEPPTVGTLWNRFVSEIGVILSTAATVVFIFFGLVLLNIVPCLGTIAFVAFSLYFAVVLMPLLVIRLWEPCTLGSAVQRCNALVRPYFVDTLAVLSLAAALYTLAVLVFAVPSTIVAGMFTTGSPGSHLVTVITSVFGSLLLVFPIAAAAMHTFNLLHREIAAANGEDGRYDPGAISPRQH